MYYKDIHGVILVFDLTDEDSFKNINFWISDIQKHGPEKVVQVLVGNKHDLCEMGDEYESVANDRQVSYEQA
jgi:GTPase SAR1 family protein